MMNVQFCNDAKSCAYWLVNETLWYETETIPRHLIFSPRRDRDRDLPRFPWDWDETETFGNYVSRPSRDQDVETETTSLNFIHMDESSFILLYKSMVWPHLEYANSVWCPYKQGDIKELDKIQKRATKLVINLKKIPYKDRLMHLKLPTL